MKNVPFVSSAKPYPLLGTRTVLCSCLSDELSGGGLRTTIPFPSPNLFLSAGCHYPVVFFSLVVLSCSLLCYLTNLYSDSIFFSCKFFKTTSDDKMLLYMLKSEYQILRRVNLLRTGQRGFHSQRYIPHLGRPPQN